MRLFWIFKFFFDLKKLILSFSILRSLLCFLKRLFHVIRKIKVLILFPSHIMTFSKILWILLLKWISLAGALLPTQYFLLEIVCKRPDVFLLLQIILYVVHDWIFVLGNLLLIFHTSDYFGHLGELRRSLRPSTNKRNKT